MGIGGQRPIAGATGPQGETPAMPPRPSRRRRLLFGIGASALVVLGVAVVAVRPRAKPPVVEPTGEKKVQLPSGPGAIPEAQAIALYEAIVGTLKAEERAKLWEKRVDDGKKAQLDADVIEQMQGAQAGEVKARLAEADKVADTISALRSRYPDVRGLSDATAVLVLAWAEKGAKAESELLARAVDALSAAPAGTERQAIAAALSR